MSSGKIYYCYRIINTEPKGKKNPCVRCIVVYWQRMYMSFLRGLGLIINLPKVNYISRATRERHLREFTLQPV